MNIFYEPVNLNQWNMFEKVPEVEHVEPFLATKVMKEGDLVLLHAGNQNKLYESGIYAFGTIVRSPYILRDHPSDYCNNKRTCDVRIDHICYGRPLIPLAETKEFISQFRTVHKIDPKYYGRILDVTGNAVKK